MVLMKMDVKNTDIHENKAPKISYIYCDNMAITYVISHDDAIGRD